MNILSFDRESSSSRLLWVSLFFIVYLIVGLYSFDDYGVSWDEPVSRNNGMVSLKYVGSILAPSLVSTDEVVQQYPDLHQYYDKDYGVAFELPLAFLERVLLFSDSKNIFLFRHLMTFLFSFAGVIAVYMLAARRFHDWRIGLLGAAFLVISPRIFAESFYNDKDVVFMAMFAIALNSAVVFMLKPAYRTAFWFALFTAILINVRIMGVLLPVATLFLVFIRQLKGELSLGDSTRAVLSYSALCIGLTVLFWPYLWADPWGNFSQAFSNMSDFRWHYDVLYLGEAINASDLPWHYIPVWVSVTTPLLYLILFLLGMGLVAKNVINRRWQLWKGSDELQDIFFLGLVVSPVLAVIILNSVLYDSWRQMYFIYPAFLLIALKAWDYFYCWASRSNNRALGHVFFSATVIFLLSIGGWMIQAHPFQNVYFNALAGSDVKTKFEVDYWGLSSRQALQYIVDNDMGEGSDNDITIWAGSFLPLKNGKLMLDPVKRERVRIVLRLEDADYIVTQYRKNLTDYANAGLPFETYYQIKVDNESILSVYKRLPSTQR